MLLLAPQRGDALALLRPAEAARGREELSEAERAY